MYIISFDPFTARQRCLFTIVLYDARYNMAVSTILILILILKAFSSAPITVQEGHGCITILVNPSYTRT